VVLGSSAFDLDRDAAPDSTSGAGWTAGAGSAAGSGAVEGEGDAAWHVEETSATTAIAAAASVRGRVANSDQREGKRRQLIGFDLIRDPNSRLHQGGERSGRDKVTLAAIQRGARTRIAAPA